MRKRKVFSGDRLLRLREKSRLTQVELARRLGISISYLNQIERNQRPLTASVLLEVARFFRVDVSDFSSEGQDRLHFDLSETLADPAFGAAETNTAEIRIAVQQAPSIASALVKLQSRHRALLDQYTFLGDRLEASGQGELNFPYDEVRDFFHQIGNYVDPLDVAAEKIAQEIANGESDILDGLSRRLEDRHKIQITMDRRFEPRKPMRRYDNSKRVLTLDAYLERSTLAFAMAHQIALLEHADVIRDVAMSARFKSPDSSRVCEVALANYFAGALMLPYAGFLEAAVTLRHDVEALASKFGASVEQVCHRLSTMQRKGSEGIPFYFLRVDRAGNITKRHSATRFQFARYGGACPLWNVHEAFETPDRMLVQLAEMPDGIRYLSMATAITKKGATHGSTQRRYAIGFGCEASFAEQVAYSDEIDTKRPRAVVEIGVSCRICERQNCAQRAFPPVGKRLGVDQNVRMPVPYTFEV